MKRGGALGYRNQIPGGFRRSNWGRPKRVQFLHLPQNFMPAGFSNSHFGQRIGSPHFYGPMRSIAGTQIKENR